MTSLQHWRVERALRRARLLCVGSSRVHPARMQEFRGYLELGGGLRYPLHLSCGEPSPPPARPARHSPPSGRARVEAELVQLSCEELTPQSLPEVVAEWYVQRYRDRPGHWTRPRGLRPVVTLSCRFRAPAASAQPLPDLVQV